MIIIGLGLIGAFTLLFVIADNFIDLLLFRTLQGVGVAFTIPASLIILRLLQGIAAAGIAAPAFALAADLSSIGGEGRQMSIITMSFGLGIALGPLVAGLLVGYFFELPFLVIGLAALGSALVVYFSMPETVHRKTAVAGKK